MTTIAVTGATGTIGRPLVEHLAARTGVRVRAASRTPANNATNVGTSVAVIEFDWQRPANSAELVAGADLLVVIPPSGQHPLRTTEILLAQARAAGVRHVVLLSTFGADFTPGFAFGRWAMESEQALAAAGVPWTVLRPNSYMSNFAGMLRPAPDGTLRLPWADGATSFVDPADVAAALAAVLRAPAEHHEAVYELTGPEALTCTDIARILSRSSGSPIHYLAASLDEVRSRMITGGAPPPFADALVELHTVMATHARARATDHVARLTGQAPRSLDEWADANFRLTTSHRSVVASAAPHAPATSGLGG